MRQIIFLWFPADLLHIQEDITLFLDIAPNAWLSEALGHGLSVSSQPLGRNAHNVS